MIYHYILWSMIVIIVFNIITFSKFRSLYRLVFWVIGIGLIILAGIRDGIGYDFYGYNQIYNTIHTNGNNLFNSGIEPLYVVVNKFCNNFGQVIFISALLGVGIKLVAIKNYSKDIMISLFLYYAGIFIMYDMGVMRQGIAMGICLLSLQYVLNKKFIKFLICITIATLFHSSAMVIIPMYFIASNQYSRKIIYTVLVILLLSSILRIDIIATKVLVGILPSQLQEKAIFYTVNYTEGSILISFIKRAIFAVVFVEFYYIKKIKDPISLLFLNMYILSLVVYVLFSPIPVLGGRGSMNLYIAQIFIVPDLIKRVQRHDVKLAILGIFILLGINSMMGPIKHGNESGQPYTPYKSILKQEGKIK